MIPTLDIRTLVLIHVAINMGQALVLVYLWRVQRNYPSAKEWALGSLLFAIGLLLFSLRNVVPAVFSEVVSNLFLLPGLMIFNFCIVRSTGRKPPYRLGLLLCAGTCAILAWYSIGDPSYPATVVAQSAFILILDLYVALACLSAKTAEGNHTFRVLGVLYLILALACTWRLTSGVSAVTSMLPQTTPRLFWIATSLVLFPMITVLLTLHTSQKLQEENHAQARHDTLTGALNRRGFGEFAEKEWARSQRHGDPFTLLLVDIDHFKGFNDQYGHQTGDLALVEVSKAAQAALRSDDIWCRYGGEEFVALLPNTPLEPALTVAERLREAVERTPILAPKRSLSVSVSIGAATYATSHASLAEVLALADAALYAAKAAGRNRVVANTHKDSEALNELTVMPPSTANSSA